MLPSTNGPLHWCVSESTRRQLRRRGNLLVDALRYRRHPHLHRQRIRRWPRWDYDLTVISPFGAPAAVLSGNHMVALALFALWLALTPWLMRGRPPGSSRRLSHQRRVLWTSVLIPPIAVAASLTGALCFRVGLF